MRKSLTRSRLIARRFIAEAAISRANELPLLARADVYQTVADMLGGAEGEAARLVAFDLRKIEEHQLTLKALLEKPSDQ